MNISIFPLEKHSFTFPNPLYANDEGLIAYGGDLNPNRIMVAYTNGIFPWYNEDDPILWWCPNPRYVLKPDEFKVSKSLRKTINSNKFEIKFDTSFVQVMVECRKIRKNKEGTWIHKEIIDAYSKIFEMGFAHSFEAYLDGELVGGGYGISIGDIFCGESMFTKESDASKVALYHLVQRLKDKGYRYIDCQVPSEHLKSLGAKPMPREEFLQDVKSSLENLRGF